MKRNWVKIILAVVLLGGIASGIVAYTMWNKDHADASQMEGIPVTAEALYKAFESDEAGANAKYVGKVVEVSGTVSEVKSDSLTQVILSFPDAMFGGVLIGIDPRHVDEVKSLKNGDQATFKGFCSGFLTDVVIKDGVRTK